MKHGKKSEQKSARTQSRKTSTASRSAGAKKSVAAASTRAKASSSSKSTAAPNNGKRTAARSGPEFSNAAIGTAFQRAIKKYVNAFRRLTD